MGRIIKVALLAVLSLVVIVLVAIAIAVWFVFTPAKLTPFIRQQVAKNLTCQTEIGTVGLTFFSTFPQFGLSIGNLILINPIPGAPSDTLMAVDRLTGLVDLKAWFRDREVVIDELIASNGVLTLYSDSLGCNNYSIMMPDTLNAGESTTLPSLITLNRVEFKKVGFFYLDKSMNMEISLPEMVAEMTGSLEHDTLKGQINLSQGPVSFEYGGEKYLQHCSTRLNLDLELGMNNYKFGFQPSTGQVNGIDFSFSGEIQPDSLFENIRFDLHVDVEPASIAKALELVPPSYQSYTKPITAEGEFSGQLGINGNYTSASMPLFTILFSFKEGEATYEGMPLKLNNLEGQARIVTDVMTDSLTMIDLIEVKGTTGRSVFSTRGRIDRLFSDIACKLNTRASLELEEFQPMVPSDLKINMSGKVNAEFLSDFTLPQVEALQFEKMKLAGHLDLLNVDLVYDSLSFTTDRSMIDFNLPNRQSDHPGCNFVRAQIDADFAEINQKDKLLGCFRNGHIQLVASDLRDTTRIPDLSCSFSFDSLAGTLDTIGGTVLQPVGKIEMAPRPGRPDQPGITLSFNSSSINAHMGSDSVEAGKFCAEVAVQNDKTAKDLVLQWPARGYIDLEKGRMAVRMLPDVVWIPAVKCNFSPEKLTIHDSKIQLDRSDFSLSGVIDNLFAWYHGDSLLRGELKFSSRQTDIDKLMALTSGMGYQNNNPDSLTVEQGESGPYLVPRGMDLHLNAAVDRAIMGPDTATNIHGDLRIFNGVLLLDGISLVTPAARMQLTAMYRTPRKNHLFLGIDYHMMDVEIEELLDMVPGIDTLMPMLRSFKGKGEFHMAAETYLDSMYHPKFSTIRGAASITGQNLVLMDGQTFSEIAKTLKFNKKTENRVDSLSAEFTIFRNEIDVYPFLIVMDKYKAVVAGRHNLDMSFDYHISLVDSPLPVKLGVDVKGTLDDMKYSLAKCRYAGIYRPASRKVVENRQLELRKQIRESLVKQVKK